MSVYRSGALQPAETLCRSLLAREPRHVRSLVLLGDIVQQSGRNKLAVKLLGQALAIDASDAAAHDTIALAYQALGRRDQAVRHFAQALALGLGDAAALIKRNAAVAEPLTRVLDAWPRHLGLGELLGAAGAGPLAQDALLLALLQARPVPDAALERLLTAIRRALSQRAVGDDGAIADADALTFFCALAQQCFLNDYVFGCDEIEWAQAQDHRNRVVDALATGKEIAALDLIVTASYLPLHRLPGAASLLERPWPDVLSGLLRQQIREPLEEQADRDAIEAMTSVNDPVSLQVRTQYEENPYPRWTATAPVKPTTVALHLRDKLGLLPAGWPETTVGAQILIAGCGTGAHSIDTAQRFPRARVLAIDISRSSLAYARRKTRELRLPNIAYAQADILQLDAIDRRFDVIEAAGVLHHLADPTAGWRSLLSLLRPNGLMFVGLYSGLARRSIAVARAFIAARGYQATADDIRACRQELMRRGEVPPFTDFASTSGCRDLLFNVMEHQFTLPQIKALLDAHGLVFLGFEQLGDEVLARFRRQFPDTEALRDLACWNAFEQTNPMTFGNMYLFWVQKREVASH
jgi:2-polyprenyl-3-methyl-5-hydroxy-6-metoxy-1,4-benzoquinol methylase